MQYIDIGLNLFSRSFPDPERLIRESMEAGVACILTGSDMEENRQVAEFVSSHDCWGTCGIHPHNADSASEEDFSGIRELLKRPGVVAVGECGLDFDRMFSTRENQIRCLENHIRLAEETGRPMFLHERDSADTFLGIFREHPGICHGSVVHCYTGNRAELEALLDMGFSIGITGWICDERRNAELLDAVKVLPLDRVMLETDAPYLTPRGVPGLARINVPANVRYVCEGLAKAMGVDTEILRMAALENTRRLFHLT